MGVSHTTNPLNPLLVPFLFQQQILSSTAAINFQANNHTTSFTASNITNDIKPTTTDDKPYTDLIAVNGTLHTTNFEGTIA
jgi:hypothetical protein